MIQVEKKIVKRTRNRHQCCECRQVIPPRSTCVVFGGLWDDGPRSYRWCLACEVLVTSVREIIHELDESLCFGELHYFIQECR